MNKECFYEYLEGFENYLKQLIKDVPPSEPRVGGVERLELEMSIKDIEKELERRK